MAKNKDTVETNDEVTTPRTKRRKVYEAIRESALPQALHDIFKQDNYELRLIRWIISGEEDYRNVTRKVNEGYEFVSESELPDWFKASVRLMDTKSRAGMVTLGDLVLMKIDSDLRQSRRDFYQKKTDAEVASVDVHVLEKKGFRNLGTKSKVVMREPKFQE